MEGFLEDWIWAWYISALPAVFAIGCALSICAELWKADRALQGEIRSRSDLDLLRSAILISMRASAVVLIVFLNFLLLDLLLFLIGVFSLRTAVAHLLVFSAIMWPVAPALFFAERRLRRLRVRSADPRIEAVYERWLLEWNQLRVNLSEIPPPPPVPIRIELARKGGLPQTVRDAA